MQDPSEFPDLADLFCQMDWDPESGQPADSDHKGRSLALIESWLRTECDWVRELIAEVELLREVIELRFVDDSARLLESNCAAYRRMLPQLLAAELDITGIGRAIATLDTLADQYRALVQRLKASRR